MNVIVRDPQGETSWGMEAVPRIGELILVSGVPDHPWTARRVKDVTWELDGRGIARVVVDV